MHSVDLRVLGLLALSLISGVMGSSQNLHSLQHVVGDDAGWSIPAISNVNYTTWASNYSFHIHDTLLFKYRVGLHTVDQVKKLAYRKCSDAEPIAHYADGFTIITLNKTGSFYFICGIPGHCEAGQKVQIVVKKAKRAFLAAAPPQASTPKPSSSVTPSVPTQGSTNPINSATRVRDCILDVKWLITPVCVLFIRFL